MLDSVEGLLADSLDQLELINRHKLTALIIQLFSFSHEILGPAV